MNMIKNFTKETKKTVVKEKIKKSATVAKKFGLAAAAIGFTTLLIVAVKKGSNKIKKNRVTAKKGKKPVDYIDAELISEEEEALRLEDKNAKKKGITRHRSGELSLQGEE